VSSGTVLIFESTIQKGQNTYLITLHTEDCTDYYPDMFRYSVKIDMNGVTKAVFRTNTYEYSPTVPLEAESVARHRFDEWESRLKNDPSGFIGYLEKMQERIDKMYMPYDGDLFDVIVIQGSPRPDGNCSILAGWIVDISENLKKTVSVVYLDDMNIHPCIGCYQCYNYGYCVFADDMREIIEKVSRCSLLVVCSPVYTNTVPGTLKLCIDRFQAYHAMNTFLEMEHNPGGMMIGVCGRKGKENFRGLTPVIDAFMGNCGIRNKGRVLIDNIDELHDIRKRKDLRMKIEVVMNDAFLSL